MLSPHTIVHYNYNTLPLICQQSHIKNGRTDENKALFLCVLTNCLGALILLERNVSLPGTLFLFGLRECVRDNVPEQLSRIDHLVQRISVTADLDQQRAR